MTRLGICRDSDIHLPSLSLRTSLRWLFRPPAELRLRASFLRRCSCLSPDQYFRLPKHPGLRSRPGKSIGISAGCVPTFRRCLVTRRYEFSGDLVAPDWCGCTRRCTILGTGTSTAGDQVTHDPRNVSTTTPLASPGFCGDLRYELLIRHLDPNMIEVCHAFRQRPTHLPSNRHAQAMMSPGTGRRLLPESGSAMQRRSDLC